MKNFIVLSLLVLMFSSCSKEYYLEDENKCKSSTTGQYVNLELCK